MSESPKLRTVAISGLLMVPLLLSGCTGIMSSQSMSIDPPPAEIENQMLDASENERVKNNLPVSSTLYLKDSYGRLAPVSLGLPESADTLVGELEALVKKGPYEAMLPAGFEGVLPEGTAIKQVTVQPEQKLAVVEFEQALGGYTAKEERQLLEAVTWTLTEHSDIEKVQLWANGEKLTAMPVNQTPLDRPLSRTMGINLEKGEGASYLQSSPVTVYFSALTPNMEQYYVPVTRLVATGQESLEAAIHELIKGPQYGEGLEQVMTSATVLDSIKAAEDGTVTVALKDDMFADGDMIPDELLESVVLTVAENKQSAKVQIMLNEHTNVIGTNNKNYSKPVTKPEYINEIKL